MYFAGNVLQKTVLVSVLACLLRWGEMAFPFFFFSKAQQKMVRSGVDALWGEHKAMFHMQCPESATSSAVNTRRTTACWWDRFSAFTSETVSQVPCTSLL